MMDRFTTHLTTNGNESFLFDEANGGETVAVFTRPTHAEDAKKVADLLNGADAVTKELVAACEAALLKLNRVPLDKVSVAADMCRAAISKAKGAA